jgi:hypothetical protein
LGIILRGGCVGANGCVLYYGTYRSLRTHGYSRSQGVDERPHYGGRHTYSVHRTNSRNGVASIPITLKM